MKDVKGKTKQLLPLSLAILTMITTDMRWCQVHEQWTHGGWCPTI